MQVQIARVLARFKQALRFVRTPSRPMVTSDRPITSIFPDAFGAKKSAMRELAAFALPRKSEAQQLSWRRACSAIRGSLCSGHTRSLIAFALRREISVHDFGLKHIRRE